MGAGESRVRVTAVFLLVGLTIVNATLSFRGPVTYLMDSGSYRCSVFMAVAFDWILVHFGLLFHVFPVVIISCQQSVTLPESDRVLSR